MLYLTRIESILSQLSENRSRDFSLTGGTRCERLPNVLPHLISGQFVEHCKPPFLQGVQPASSLPLLKDIHAHSLVTLIREETLGCIRLREVLNKFSEIPASN